MNSIYCRAVSISIITNQMLHFRHICALGCEGGEQGALEPHHSSSWEVKCKETIGISMEGTLQKIKQLSLPKVFVWLWSYFHRSQSWTFIMEKKCLFGFEVTFTGLEAEHSFLQEEKVTHLKRYPSLKRRHMGPQTILVTNLVTNSVTNLSPNLVITKQSDKFVTKFVTDIGVHQIWWKIYH